MRKALLIAALMMTTSIGAAHAGDTWSFMVNGQRVKIERPRNCTSLSCINIVAPGLNNSNSDDDSANTTTSNAPAPTNQPVAAAPVQQTPVQQYQQPVQQAPAQQQVATAPVTQAPVASVPPLPGQATSSANVTTLAAPANNQATAAPGTIPALPQVAQPVQQVQQPVQQVQQPAQQQVAAVAPTAPAQTVAPAPVANGPIGVWMTEKNEGKVHVVNCGTDICGYAVEKNGSDGAQVLINMKPEGDSWHGRIHDTRGGGTYDSTIAMRGNDKMRVQGCAFGGMFCGGQTWTRAN
jgi:uncharacterized protein (DUF2147 family)